MGGNDIIQVVEDFKECTNALNRMDLNKLPFELQLKYAEESIKLTAAINKYNDEIKKIIVIASAMGRV